MKRLFLLSWMVLLFVTIYSHASYGAFSYDIDIFTQVGGPSGSSAFDDQFDDDAEPADGPSGPSTYLVPFSFSADTESTGVLNLNSNDASSAPGDDPEETSISATLNDSVFFFNSGSGGSLEAKFRFPGGVTENTRMGIKISELYDVKTPKSISYSIYKTNTGRIIAGFDSFVNGILTNISKLDTTSSLSGITNINPET